jgi:hypothetical protein
MSTTDQFDDWWMPNEVHLAILRQGSPTWNAWRAEHPKIVPMLRSAEIPGIRLEGADLANCELSGAILRNADLSGSVLYQAELYRADLSGAVLGGCDMRGAKLHEAILTGATLKNANLYRADFIQTLLDKTDFTGAYLHTTAFSNVDLMSAIGLELLIHGGPSSIDLHTLLRSASKLPGSFLSGAGIPSATVARMLEIARESRPSRLPSCFISYGGMDEAFARGLYERLKSNGLRVWFAPEDMKAGQKVFPQLDAAIRRHDRLILVLSEDSLRSQWVGAEVLRARARETAEGRQVLIPIRLLPFEALQGWSLLDTQSGKDVAAEVREYHIPDFSNWKDQSSFDAAASKLVDDLRLGSEQNEFV